MRTVNTNPVTSTAPPPACGVEAACAALGDAERVRMRQLGELERLRVAGMGTVQRISDWLDGGMDGGEARMLAGRSGMIAQFVRTSRAIRQIMVLEQELVGLRPAPDRDAPPEPHADDGWDDAEGARRGDGLALREYLFDYDNGPMDQVVARIRAVLAVAAPEDDPFAPAVRRRAGDAEGGGAGCAAPAGGDDRAGAGEGEVTVAAAARRAAVRPGSTGAGLMADAGDFVTLDGPAVGRRGRDPPD